MLKTDCAFFPGDRPCSYHKESGIKCDTCDYYIPIRFKILIIKLDAIGDVLRTTSILEPLKEKYPKAHITWCTRKNARELFLNNQLVNSVIFVNDDAEYRLSEEYYDLVINLDTSKISSAIAALANSDNKIGFLLDKKGSVIPTASTSMEWLEMSAFDDVKRNNSKTYQQLMYNIIGVNTFVRRPVLNIRELDSALVESRFKINRSKLTIGLNIGVGSKWPNKGWPLEKWEELILKLEKENFNLLLLGGPEEQNKNTYLAKKYDFLIDTGCDNSILEFSAIVNVCDILITADTFALHIGTALEKYIIALFGPTSVSEIELYGRGKKLIGNKKCECFYQRSCHEDESCMSTVNSDMVYKEVLNIVNIDLKIHL